VRKVVPLARLLASPAALLGRLLTLDQRAASDAAFATHAYLAGLLCFLLCHVQFSL